MKLLSIILSILCAVNLSAANFILSGTIDKGGYSDVELYTSSDGINLTYIEINGNNYSTTLSADSAALVYIGAKLTDYRGKSSHIFVPLYISPDRGQLTIDLTEKDNSAHLKTSDKDNAAICEYYSDFIPKHLRMPINTMTELTAFLKKITSTADSMANHIENKGAKQHLSLCGYFSRVQLTRQLQQNLRGSGQKLSLEAISDIKDTRDLLKQPGVNLFKQDLVPLIIADIAIGKSTDERMKRVKEHVSDTQILALVEKELKSREYSMVGGNMPETDIIDINGNTHRLSEFKGKYVYVDFWASWCGPCNNEIPYLKQLEETLGNDQVVFVAISIDEDVDDWKSAVKRHNLHGNQFLGNQEIARLLNITGIPRYVIYDKEGHLFDPNAPRPSTGESVRQLLKNLK